MNGNPNLLLLFDEYVRKYKRILEADCHQGNYDFICWGVCLLINFPFFFSRVFNFRKKSRAMQDQMERIKQGMQTFKKRTG